MKPKFSQIFILVLIFLCKNIVFAQKADFYKQNVIKEIRVTLKSKNWMNTLDSFKLNGSSALIGKVTVDGKAFEGAGVRYRGNASFKYGEKRNPFHIKLNQTQPENALENGQTSLILTTSLRDPSMVREMLGFEIAGKYMPAPKACYAKLYINEEYRGLFVCVEPIEEAFLQRNFGSSTNTLIKCAPSEKLPIEGCRKNSFCALEYEEKSECYALNYEVQKGSSEDLQTLITTLNKNPQDIAKYLDVDKTLWMLAFNNVCVNLSSYTGQQSSNFYLYKDNNGRFVPIMWDLNLCFGSFKNTGIGSDLSNDELVSLDPMLHASNELKPLIFQLFKTPMYQRMYASHVKQIVNDNFINIQALQKQAAGLQTLIMPAFNSDNFKSYKESDLKKSLTDVVGNKSKIPGLIAFMTKRTEFLKKSSIFTIEAPSVSVVKVGGREKFSNGLVDKFIISAKVDNYPKQVKLYYRSDKTQPYTEVDMGEESKGKFKYTIEPKGAYDKIEYYITSENAQAMDFFPSTYLSTPLTASLSKLNK